jgi:hypothetical protein
MLLEKRRLCGQHQRRQWCLGMGRSGRRRSVGRCAPALELLLLEGDAKQTTGASVELGGQPEDFEEQPRSIARACRRSKRPLFFAAIEEEPGDLSRRLLSNASEMDVRMGELRLVAREDHLREVPGRRDAPRRRVALVREVDRRAAELSIAGSLVATLAELAADDRRPVSGARASEARSIVVSVTAREPRGRLLSFDQGRLSLTRRIGAR